MRRPGISGQVPFPGTQPPWRGSVKSHGRTRLYVRSEMAELPAILTPLRSASDTSEAVRVPRPKVTSGSVFEQEAPSQARARAGPITANANAQAIRIETR